jgi:hypothetical protein
MSTTQDLVSDQQLADAFPKDLYAEGTDPRSVISLALLKYACGYSTGSATFKMCFWLGLVNVKLSRTSVPILTKLGKLYLYAAHSNQTTL